MSTIVAQTLSNGTVSTSTANCIQGSAKAWVNFNGGLSGTAGVINGSYNVSSITVVTTGTYTVNFTASMPNANYGFTGGGEYYPAAIAIMCVTAWSRSTTSIGVNVCLANGSVTNPDRCNVSIFSS